MAEKLHLYAGFFGIHGLDGELFHFLDLDLFFCVFFFVDEQVGECDCGLLFIYNLGFISLQLTLDDFFNEVDGNIHIVADLFGTDDGALHRNGDLDFLTFFFHAESDDCFCVVVKISLQLADLLDNVFSQPRGDIHILSGNRITHKHRSFVNGVCSCGTL